MAVGDGGLEIDFDIPLRMRFQFDATRVERRVGTKLANAVRKRIRAGIGLRSGTDLKETGALIRSIRYNRHTGTVRPSTKTRQDVSTRARSNYGLMKIYISGKFRRKGYQRLEPTDPMGTEDAALHAAKVQMVQEAIEAEIKAGKANIIDEIRRRSRGRR